MKKIINIDGYYDGGTIIIKYQDNTELYIDERIGTKTKFHIYDKYPSNEDAKQILLSIEEYGQLIHMILNYNWRTYHDKNKEITNS